MMERTIPIPKKIPKKIGYLVAEVIGEGIHTSLRKFCDSPESNDAHVAITNMPDEEWNSICKIVANEILKALKKVASRKGH